MLIAVGSTNPVKVGAARTVAATYHPTAEVRGVAVASGVPDQPWGDDETIRGAVARAAAARDALDADWGIGIEGGVVDDASGSVRTCAWAAVVSATAGRALVARFRSSFRPRLLVSFARAWSSATRWMP